MPWYTYILTCSDSTLYTGVTNDLVNRIHKHNTGTGAKYTKGRSPVTLSYFEEFTDRSSAQKREYEIKQLSKNQKVLLIKK